MSESFKNIKELYQALVDGKTIQYKYDNTLVKIDCCQQSRRYQNDLRNAWTDCSYSFNKYWLWSIYEEPKWYDNIPRCGVLCFVTNSKGVITETIRLILGINEHNQYISHGGLWNNAVPLTKEEVMQYILGGECQ